MNLGIGVMLNHLSGNRETVEAYQAGLNKKIVKAVLENDVLELNFEDNTRLQFWDDGQSCCESRYMRTDDDLNDLVGGIFLGAELKEAPEVETQYDVHEVQFLEVKTDKGSIVMSSHNEHNGYYGGFAIICRK
jgi:hypothetical protein